MDIYVKLKYANIHRKSGWLRYLSGVRRSFDLYLGETEEDLVPYMTSTLLKEKGWMGEINIEIVTADGNVYNILTKYIRSNPFWRCNGHYVGNIINNATKIAKIEISKPSFFKQWQAKMILNSSKEIIIYPYGDNYNSPAAELLRGHRGKIRIKKDDLLVMEFDDHLCHKKRPSKIGWVKTDTLQQELLLVISLYYYFLYPEYMKDDNDSP